MPRGSISPPPVPPLLGQRLLSQQHCLFTIEKAWTRSREPETEPAALEFSCCCCSGNVDPFNRCCKEKETFPFHAGPDRFGSSSKYLHFVFLRFSIYTNVWFPVMMSRIIPDTHRTRRSITQTQTPFKLLDTQQVSCPPSAGAAVWTVQVKTKQENLSVKKRHSEAWDFPSVERFPRKTGSRVKSYFQTHCVFDTVKLSHYTARWNIFHGTEGSWTIPASSPLRPCCLDAAVLSPLFFFQKLCRINELHIENTELVCTSIQLGHSVSWRRQMVEAENKSSEGLMGVVVPASESRRYRQSVFPWSHTAGILRAAWLFHLFPEWHHFSLFFRWTWDWAAHIEWRVCTAGKLSMSTL